MTPTYTSTKTPTPTPTPSFTATPTCANGVEWRIGEESTVGAHASGTVWLTSAVPIDGGWGIFWLHYDAGLGEWARLFYSQLDFFGALETGPLHLIDIPRIPFRGRYYLVAWHTDHFGLLIADRSRLYYYNLSPQGVLSGRRIVGPTLFTSPVYDQEADGDLDSYPAGFVAVIEGDCFGHSCSYAFRLDAQGNPTSSVYDLVDFDLTHQFYPRVVYGDTGFVILSVKDISLSNGGVVTKYMTATGSPATRQKVVPNKEYLWDEFPDLAWNGDHLAALWTENSARDHDAPWQVHFASFRRQAATSVLIHDRLLDVQDEKSPYRWTTQIHAVGPDWIAQYTRWRSGADPLAVYQWLGSNGEIKETLAPFSVSLDALGSDLHPLAPMGAALGIARGSREGGGSRVSFQSLSAPRCAP